MVNVDINQNSTEGFSDSKIYRQGRSQDFSKKGEGEGVTLRQSEGTHQIV